MRITQAEYITSMPSIRGFDLPPLPMVAFIGRSNVGKSSLINHLVNRKKLVKTSSTPGKTQLINFFLINESFYLVDLPGYGFASVPVSVKNSWKEMILEFLFKAPDLRMIFQLVDIRHKPSKEDVEFHQMLLDSHMNYRLVANKSDKLKKNQQQKSLAEIRKTLGVKSPILTHSSLAKQGKEELIKALELVLEAQE